MSGGRRIARFAGRMGLALGSSVLFALYANIPILAFVPYFALVPWVVLYTDPRAGKVSHGYYVFAAWVGWMLQYQQAWKYGWFVPPIMALFYIPMAWLFTPLLRGVHRWNLPRALSVPLVWTTVEALRARFGLGHFELYGLGYSQARLAWLVQIADVTGVWGLTFLVAAVNGWVADAIFAWREAAWSLRNVAWRPLARTGLPLAVAFAAVAGYGAYRLGTMRFEDGPRLAVIQPNILHTLNNPIGTHVTQTIQTERAVEPGSADLIVWPENAILDRLDRPGVYLSDMKWLVERKKAWLLLGSLGSSPDHPGETTNAAVLIDDHGTIRQQYDKQILYPWSEYIPLDGVLGAVSTRIQRFHRSLIRRAWGYLAAGHAGTVTTLFQLPWRGGTIPFAALICVENTYPPVPAEAARLGARFFVNITSEGEVGGVVQEQLLRISMMRAVENRISYVRCGNTGISGFVDPAGRLTRLLRGKRGGTISVAGSVTAAVPLSDGKTTIYARSRDAVAIACVAATLALAAGSWFRRRPAAVTAAVAALAVALSACGGPVRPGADAAGAPAALARARDAAARKDAPAALAAAGEACATEAECGEALPIALEAWRARGAPDDAAEFFDAVAVRWPSLEADARAMASIFLEDTGRPALALAAARQAAAARPDGRNEAVLGSILLRQGFFAEAEKALAEAVRLQPRDTRARQQWIRALWASGDVAGARREIESLTAEAPRFGPGWALAGLLRYEAGEREAALAAVSRALEADPDNLEARLVRVRIALREGRLADAERVRDEITSIERGLGRAPRRD